MKRLLFNLILPFAAYTQPTIENANNIPPVGTTFPAALTVIPQSELGSPGMNQTWDFSSYSFSNFSNFNYIDPSQTPFSGTFTDSEHCFQVVNYYSFIDVQPDGLYFLGFNAITAGGPGDYTQNSRKYIQFPYTYNTSFADTYSSAGIQYSINVTYDAYGTLILPGFTYSNVIRSTEVEDGGEIITRYFLSQPLALLGIHFASDGFFYWAQIDESASLEEATNKHLLAPNPCTNEIKIDPTHVQEQDLLIHRIDGSLVMKINLSELIESGGVINVEHLDPGTYFLSGGGLHAHFIKN